MATKLPEVSNHPEMLPAPEPSPALPRRRRSLAWVWLLVLGVGGYFGYRYYAASQQQKQADNTKQARQAGNRAVSVVMAPVKSGDIPVFLRGLGTVAPLNSASVKSRVDGQLIAIHFTEGQMVTGPTYDRNEAITKDGDLLAEVDPRPFQVQLEQAQGQLARDQAQLNDAKVNLARYQKLWEEQVIAKQQLDTQASSVGQFEGSIKADQAAIHNAELQITYSKIRAPISGRAGLRLIDTGNVIHAGDATGIVIIDQMQPISVLFTIPADSLPPVLKKLQAHATLRVDAYDRDDRNKIASGILLTVDNQIDASTGTSRLKATFDNKNFELFPNQFVNCRLLLDTKRNAVIVSAPALQRGPQGNFVYVVTPDKTAVATNVTVGITEGDDVEIVQGLKAGDNVVVEGQDKLQDGSKVDTRAGAPAGQGGRGRQGGPGRGTAPPAGPTQPGEHKTGGRRPQK
jgi:multidrug efflux system membrane fusion protein